MTGRIRSLAQWCFATGMLAVVAGCGNGDGKNAPAAGGSTPEETFKNAQAAAEKEDWKGILANMTTESQEVYSGMMAFTGVMIQGFAGLGGPEAAEEAKKIKAVLDKHGLTEETLKKVEPDPTSADPIASMKKLVEPIKDRGQFVADMMAALKSSKGFKDTSPMQKGATLKDVKIEGNTAKGAVEFEKGGKKDTTPVTFKKVDGKWLMDLTDAMKSSMGPSGPAGGGLPGDLPSGNPGDLPKIPPTGDSDAAK